LTTCVWRRLDEPEMELAHVESLSSAAGTQIGYTSRGDRVVGYASETFEADIVFDAEGFVTTYEGFLERVS
jgi:hypothetical protein